MLLCFTIFCFRCPLKCSRIISEDMSKDIFSKFYKLNTKDEQDIYLQGLIEVRNIQQRRKRKQENKNRSKSYWHFVRTGTKKYKVCLNTFCAVHAITVDRVKRIKKLLCNNETPIDKRGKHPKGNAIPVDIRNLIRDHISSYPSKQSHYSGKDYSYLDSRLCITCFALNILVRKLRIAIISNFFMKTSIYTLDVRK